MFLCCSFYSIPRIPEPGKFYPCDYECLVVGLGDRAQHLLKTVDNYDPGNNKGNITILSPFLKFQ